MRMRICFIHREYPPYGQGGICTYVYNIAHALTRLGHVVHVIARSNNYRDYTERDGEVYVHRISALVPNRVLHYVYLGAAHSIRLLTGLFMSRVLASRRVALKLEQLIAEEGVQIVEAPEWEAENFWYTLFSDRKIPTVVKLHTPTCIIRELNDLPPERGYKFLSWMERQETLLADQITSPSIALARQVSQKWGIPPQRIEVVPNPIDTRIFLPLNEPHHRRSPVILYTGRIEKRKGVHVLFEALPRILRRIPEARVRLIGADTNSGPAETSFVGFLLSRLDHKMRAAVEWCGPRPRTELVHEYQTCGVCVVPSLFENFPNTCLEAMACGAPVVASQTGGLAEIVESGVSGLLVPPDDPESLADAVLMLLENAALARQMGLAARQRIEAVYSPRQIGIQTAKLYERVIAEAK